MSLLQLEVNTTVGLQYQTSQEVALFGLFSVGSSCSFLYINSVLLFTLRSKQVFCETARYILLYNLLFADTAHMVSIILLYLLAALRMRLTYYSCAALILLSDLTLIISPLTLSVMSLERFVAVCYPLRHAAIFTTRSTGRAIALVWAWSFIYMLIRVFMLLYLLTQTYISVYMSDFCSKEAVIVASVFNDLEQTCSSTVFLSTGVIIITSYVGVALVARSAATGKASARKALQTLLLHLIQLSLILTSSFFSNIIAAFGRTVGRLALTRVYGVLFVFLSILPRCLSALIYGLKDQTIRPVLMQNLCCQWRCSVVLNMYH